MRHDFVAGREDSPLLIIDFQQGMLKVIDTETCRSPEILAVAPGEGGSVKIAASGLPDNGTCELGKGDPIFPSSV